MLAAKYGGKRVLGLGVFCTAILTFLTPFATACVYITEEYFLYILIIARIFEGFAEVSRNLKFI